jgi:hypothetical protein
MCNLNQLALIEKLAALVPVPRLNLVIWEIEVCFDIRMPGEKPTFDSLFQNIEVL